MSHRLIAKYRQRLAGESGLAAHPWGGRVSVAPGYPNTYHHGMSNLGVQAVYQLLNQRPDTRCERFFLPDPEDLAEHRRTGFPLLSLETQRPLNAFDLIAFSLSFDNDYLHLPVLFELAQLPLWRAARAASPVGAVRRRLRLPQPRAARRNHRPVCHRRGRSAPRSAPRSCAAGRRSTAPATADGPRCIAGDLRAVPLPGQLSRRWHAAGDDPSPGRKFP